MTKDESWIEREAKLKAQLYAALSMADELDLPLVAIRISEAIDSLPQSDKFDLDS